MAWPATSVVGPAQTNFKNRLGLIGGNNFLTSQLDYLRNVDCGETEVHFICSEKYQHDWQRVMAQFGHRNAIRVLEYNWGEVARTIRVLEQNYSGTRFVLVVLFAAHCSIQVRVLPANVRNIIPK